MSALNQERAQQVRGLLLLAVLLIVAVIWRAHRHHMLSAGWWRLW